MQYTLAGVLAAVLAAPACAQVVDPQTRTVGPQLNGRIVASSNQLMTPAGMIVQLASQVRAKAVAVNRTLPLIRPPRC